jgi:hypothetical protein
MAIVQAFRGVLFDTRKTGELARLLAPSRDPLTPAAWGASADADEHCAARLLADSPETGVMVPAWLDQGFLCRRERPALYWFTQDFPVGHRRRLCRGLLARASLRPDRDVSVFQEALGTVAVHPDGAGIEPRLALYSGESAPLAELFQGVETGEPLVAVTDAAGVARRVWEVSEPSLVASACERLAPAHLLLPEPGPVWAAPVLTALLPASEAGELARPFARLAQVPEEFDFNRLFERLGASFDVYPLYGPEAIQGLLDKAAPGEIRIAVYIHKPRRCLLMVPKDELPALPDDGRSTAWQGLDSVVLRRRILEPILELDRAKQSDLAWLGLCREIDEAVVQLEAGGPYRIAFLVNPARIPQILELAREGEQLPAGTIDFRPRLPSGLVMDVEG